MQIVLGKHTLTIDRLLEIYCRVVEVPKLSDGVVNIDVSTLDRIVEVLNRLEIMYGSSAEVNVLKFIAENIDILQQLVEDHLKQSLTAYAAEVVGEGRLYRLIDELCRKFEAPSHGG